MDETRRLLPALRPHDDRWRFLRDVLVFQIKMLADNARDFALIPVSLVAALIDLIFRGEREGALFYRVLHWGAESEKMIDVYSAIEPRATLRDSAEGESPSSSQPEFSIDAVVSRLERVVVREYKRVARRRASRPRWIGR